MSRDGYPIRMGWGLKTYGQYTAVGQMLFYKKMEVDYLKKNSSEFSEEISTKLGTTTYIVTSIFNHENNDDVLSKISRLIEYEASNYEKEKSQ